MALAAAAAVMVVWDEEGLKRILEPGILSAGILQPEIPKPGILAS